MGKRRLVYRDELLDAIDPGEAVGIRALADRLGVAVRDIVSLVDSLESVGLLVVEHPHNGYLGGSRLISRAADLDARPLAGGER